MRTEIIFQDVRRSDYVEDFITKKVENMTGKLVQPDNDIHVTVRLQQDRHRTQVRHPLYHCEVTLKSGMSSKTYKTLRQDRNVFRAIVACMTALKTMLSKNHDRMRNDRRRRRIPEITPPSPIIPTLP